MSRTIVGSGKHGGERRSIMFTTANLGGALLPWVIGYSSQQLNDLRVGLAAPLAAGVLMHILYRRNWTSAPVSVHSV